MRGAALKFANGEVRVGGGPLVGVGLGLPCVTLAY